MTVRRGSMRNIINVGITFHGLQCIFSFLFNPKTHPSACIAKVEMLGPRVTKRVSSKLRPGALLLHQTLQGPFPLPALLSQLPGGQWEGTGGAGGLWSQTNPGSDPASAASWLSCPEFSLSLFLKQKRGMILTSRDC